MSLYSCDVADRCCFMGVWFVTRCTHSRPRSFITQLHFYPFEHLSNCCSCKPPENWIRHSLRLNLCLDKNSGSCSRLWTARSQPPTLRSARKPSIHRSPAVMARCRHALGALGVLHGSRPKPKSVRWQQIESQTAKSDRSAARRLLGSQAPPRHARIMSALCTHVHTN